MAVKAFRVRKPYDASEDVGISFENEETLTQQQFADECDINNIMKRYQATGVLMHVNAARPEYGDFSDPVDFQSALNTVIEAEMMFAELPADLRDRFGNDPKQLLEFIADDANRDEAVKLGIVKAPEEPPPPMAVRVVADEKADPPPPQPKGP